MYIKSNPKGRFPSQQYCVQVMCLESLAHLLVMVNFSSNFLVYCSTSSPFKIALTRVGRGRVQFTIGIYRKDGTENVCSCLRYASQSHRRTAVRRQRGFKEMVSCPLFRFNRSLFLILIIIQIPGLIFKNVCMTSSSSPPTIHPSTSLIAENVLLTSPKDLLSLSLSLSFTSTIFISLAADYNSIAVNNKENLHNLFVLSHIPCVS